MEEGVEAAGEADFRPGVDSSPRDDFRLRTVDLCGKEGQRPLLIFD